jgi:N-methylhydantoinase A
MRLDVPRTRAAVADFAGRTGLSPEVLCQGVLEVVNANMEGAIRVISVERGHDPREFALVSFGGAGGMHAADLARRLSIPTVLVPAHPGILSAYGMLVSDYVQEYAQTLLVPVAELTRERAEAAFRELEARGRETMREEGVAPQSIEISRFVDMGYVGQSFELVVPWSDHCSDEFHRRHESRYGYADSTRATQIVNVRIQVVGPAGVAHRPLRVADGNGGGDAHVDTVPMWGERGWLQTPVYDRQRLQPGQHLPGPALITEYSATTVVPDDFTARIDDYFNLVLHRHR